MKNFKLGLFSYMMKNVGMKCIADTSANAPSAARTPLKDNLTQAKDLLKNIQDNRVDSQDFIQLDALLKSVDATHKEDKAKILQEMDDLIKKDATVFGAYSTNDKSKLIQMRTDFVASYKEAEVKQSYNIQVIQENTKKEIVPLKRELLENTSIVQDYAPKINLGSALSLINKQTGTPEQKLAAAKLAVEKSGIAFSANNEGKFDGKIIGYDFSRSPSEKDDKVAVQVYNSKRAIEAYKLIGFIDALAKDPAMQKRLLESNIPADRPVNTNSILDLMMDFDDDGMLEAINGTDKSGLWKRFTSALGFGTAMQSEFMGEIQARNGIDESRLDVILNKYKIVKGAKESLPDFAKRARSILLLRADMLQSTDMSDVGDKNMYKNSPKNKESLDNTTKLVAELKKSIAEKMNTTNVGPVTISDKDVNAIANQMSANILKWVTTIGVGAVNMDTLLKKMGQAVAVGKTPGLQEFLVLDETVVVNILKGENLKLNGSAGAGVGAGTGEIVPFAHIGFGGQLTTLNHADLKKLDGMKGNFTIGVGVNAGLSFANGLGLSPIPSLDIKWNDKIDTLENAGIRLGSYLDAATQLDATGKVTLNLEKVPNDIDPSLIDALTMLKSVIETGGGTLSGDQQMAHAILMKQRFLSAFRLSLANEGKLGGFSLAGVKFIFLPGALGFGPTFQNIGNERKATVVETVKRKLTGVDVQKALLASYGLELTGKTLKQIAGFDAKKITLADGLVWSTNNTIVLTEKDAFDIVGGGSLSDSLGVTEKSNILTIGKKTSELSKTIITTQQNTELEKIDISDISPESLGISVSLLAQINELNIDVLIRQSEAFMRIMTKKPINFKAAEASIVNNKKLKLILMRAKDERKLNEVMLYIDSLLVGDDITRGFNKAKTDKKFFEQYKKTLIAKAPQKLKSELAKMSQESLKISDISFAFNSTNLRAQELTLMNNRLNLNAKEKSELKSADQKLIQTMGSEKELKTMGHGYLLMARNRRGAGLQGIVDIPNGGYLKREPLNLTPEKKMEIVNQMQGLDKLIKKNILAKFSADPVISAELQKIDASKFKPNVKGEISITLSGDTKLNLNLANSRVFSALYGEVEPGKQNGVCLNVATLIEPVLSGEIRGPKDEVILGTVMNEFYMNDERVGNSGETKTSEFSIAGGFPEGKPKANQAPQQSSTPGVTGGTPVAVTPVAPVAQPSPAPSAGGR